MQKKPRAGEKNTAIGGPHINLAEGTARLSSMMQSYKVRIKGVSYEKRAG